MTGLICGVVNLGGLSDTHAVIDRMIDGLHDGRPHQVDIVADGHVAMAQVSIAPHTPLTARFYRGSDTLLCGAFDLLYRSQGGCDVPVAIEKMTSARFGSRVSEIASIDGSSRSLA